MMAFQKDKSNPVIFYLKKISNFYLYFNKSEDKKVTDYRNIHNPAYVF